MPEHCTKRASEGLLKRVAGTTVASHCRQSSGSMEAGVTHVLHPVVIAGINHHPLSLTPDGRQ